MHQALNDIYEHHQLQLAASKKNAISKSVFETAMQWLHDNENFDAKDLAEGSPHELMSAINRTLQHALSQGIKQSGVSMQVPHALKKTLKNNIFVFSGLKTYHQLKQATSLLRDEQGNLKPWNSFRKDVLSLHDTYNEQHLQAEYNFAASTAQMAARWADFEHNAERYHLQFRTSADEKVRASHQALHNTTLPHTDPFWRHYVPPLDWNCRCTVVQVLKDQYPISDSKQAIAKAMEATTRIDKDGHNRAAMFRFNPAIDKVIFPPQHPYFKVNRDTINAIASLNQNDEYYQRRKTAETNLIKWYKENLPETKTGKFMAKRFEVNRPDLDKPIIVNANFYNELISKFKNDKNYVLKLEIAQKAHELIAVAQYHNTEKARHDNGTFMVYGISHSESEIVMKVKVNSDGYFLHYLMIKH